MPADVEDLAFLMRALPQEIPVTVIGLGSNLLVRDGGVEGVVVRLSGARLRQGRRRRKPHHSRRGARPTSASPRMRSKPASAASPSITASPARSAARSA